MNENLWSFIITFVYNKGMENTKLISIVVPMYNECEGLHGFFEVLFQGCQNDPDSQTGWTGTA